jgi:glycosyltransferase involved in cell wall biosynthesis
VAVKILVLTDEIYPDGVSGLGKTVFNECAALARRGHIITVLVRSVDHSLPKESTISKIKVIRFFGPERHHVLYRFYPISILVQVAFWLYRCSADYDILYLHNPIYILPVRLTRSYRHAPIVYTFHASIAAEIHTSADRKKYGRLRLLAHGVATLLGIMERWALRRTSAILPRSRFTLEEVRQMGCIAHVPDTEHLIPLGVDIESYKPGRKSVARTKLGLAANRPILITVRRLDGRMGLTNLIEAIRIVRDHFPQVLQLIAGRGYMQPTLQALIESFNLKDNVRLLGFVSEDDLPAYLSASDLFVLPTETLEGFGLATIEALATGVPVVGTPIGATPEILKPIEPALLTHDTSPMALAQSLAYWLERQEQLDELSHRCRQAVVARYNIDHVAKELESLFFRIRQLSV